MALMLVCGFALQACQRDVSPAPTPQPTSAPTAAAPVPTPEPLATPSPQPTAAATLELGQPSPTAAPQLATFFDDQRLMYEPNWYVGEVQAFLDGQAGPLKGARYQVGSESHSFAEVLVSQTSYYSVNPRVILALMQSQNGLLSNAQPSSDQVGWAIGFEGDRGNWRGIRGQVRWAVRQMFYARRDYPARVDLTFADNSTAPVSADWTLSQYVIARVLAPTTTPARLPALMQRFQETYTAYFGDPRVPPDNWPAPAAPFLSRPLEQTFAVTSFFDHDAPFLTRDPDGSVVTYWGHA
ncbi:MAG TPA: peptidase M23, partial [Roseiflexaceae bacterium]|nr:peptidase M23 [Roseiflexaceae bacterium]